MGGSQERTHVHLPNESLNIQMPHSNSSLNNLNLTGKTIDRISGLPSQQKARSQTQRLPVYFPMPTTVNRVLAYETLSETDFGLGTDQGFRPNVFVNIEPYLDDKLRAMDIYASELGEFPFPRSHEAIRALATLRGAASGFKSAEAFELLRERL